MLIEQLHYNMLFRWCVGREMSHAVSHGRPEFSGVGVVLSVLSRFFASGEARIAFAAGAIFTNARQLVEQVLACFAASLGQTTQGRIIQPRGKRAQSGSGVEIREPLIENFGLG